MVTFVARDFDDSKKIVTGYVTQIFSRQCEVIYRNWKGELDYIRVATSKLTVVKYLTDDEFLGYNNMMIGEKNSFYKVW